LISLATGDVAMLAAIVAVAGLGAGVLAGLLGVGGGIILVPVLDYAFGVVGVSNELRMHLAVGTSLASIVPTAIVSARAHRLRGAIDPVLARRWSPAIALGAALGAIIASRLEGRALSAVFAAVALVVAVRMIWHSGKAAAGGDRQPMLSRWLPLPVGIGMVSALMGIGGGTLSVPVMTWLGLPVHRAVGTSAWFGLWIAIPAALGYAWLGAGLPGLPALSLGYVNVLALAVLLPSTVVAAPLGARIAHGLSRKQLSLAFGAFLLLTSARMVYRTLAG
jgi:uncharacterized membrane protein YfcA